MVKHSVANKIIYKLEKQKKPVTGVLFGAGNRGSESYGPYALAYPDELKFVAVAEPNLVRRERFPAAHGILKERQFDSWENVLECEQMADAVFNCTQDQMHYASGSAALSPLGFFSISIGSYLCNILARYCYVESQFLVKVLLLFHLSCHDPHINIGRLDSVALQMLRVLVLFPDLYADNQDEHPGVRSD